MEKFLLLIVVIGCASASLHAQRPGLEIINPAPGRQPTSTGSRPPSGSSQATRLRPFDATQNWQYPYEASPEKWQKLRSLGNLPSDPRPPLDIWDLIGRLGKPDVIESLSGPLKFDLGSVVGGKDAYSVRCIWFAKKASYTTHLPEAWFVAYVNKDWRSVPFIFGWHLMPEQYGQGHIYGSVEGGGKRTRSGNVIETGKYYPPGEDLPSPASIRISYKPRAAFTEEGCRNDFAGAVTLEVQFLASGTIGTISVVKGAPYGLTEQAIAAAKQIRFEPMKHEGRILTSRKQIKFDFDPTVSCSR